MTNEELLTEVKKEIVSSKIEMKNEIFSSKEELRKEISSSKDEMRKEISSSRAEMKKEIVSSKDEMMRHGTVLQEQLVKEVRTVAEGHSIIRNEMKRGFDEVNKKISDVEKAVRHLADKVDVHDKKLAKL